MPKSRRIPKGLDPHEKAQLIAYYEGLDAQERQAVLALKMAKAQGRRDILASIAQASAVNPMWTNVAAGLLGGGLAVAGGLIDRARDEAFLALARQGKGLNDPMLHFLRPGKTLGQNPLETLGEGMMLLAGAKTAADAAGDLIKEIRGTPPSNPAITFDIAEGGGASIAPMQTAPFQVQAQTRRPR